MKQAHKRQNSPQRWQGGRAEDGKSRPPTAIMKEPLTVCFKVALAALPQKPLDPWGK